MYTLDDVLRILVRYGVEPGEIDITRETYRYITRQAREIFHEEEEQKGGREDDELY